MTVATAPHAKPVLSRGDFGLWRCESGYVRADGISPEFAFEAWKIAARLSAKKAELNVLLHQHCPNCYSRAGCRGGDDHWGPERAKA